MARLRAIALAITVLTVGAPCAATADLFGRGDCTPEPGSAAFLDPIGCRLWRLRTITYTTLGRGAFRVALLRASDSAWDKVFVGEPHPGAVEAVPRHNEVSDALARKICRGLSVPEIGK